MYRTSSSNVGSGVRMLSQSQRGEASPARSPSPGAAAAPVTRMALSDFEKLVTIAKGSFGTVYKAVRKDNGRVYALKQVEISNMNRAEREEAVDEVRARDASPRDDANRNFPRPENRGVFQYLSLTKSRPRLHQARVLAGLDSKYVIKYYDCFLEDGKLNIVMQYAPNGTLHSRLQAQRGKGLPEDKVWQFFIQSLLGLRHVHSKKIIHRDVKSLNLFFDQDDNVLLGDLGIAKVLSPNTMFARTIVGTPYYLSPELCEDKPYNEKSDVWALGVVLYEMCAGGKHPFDAQNEGALIRKIMKGAYAPLPGGKFSSQLSDVLRACLTMDHRARPDTAAVLRNPAVVSRARSLGIELDPDAKNVSARDIPAVRNAVASKHAHEGEAQVRAPLAEVTPFAAPPSWELPVNPNPNPFGDANVSHPRSDSRRVHRPPRPPAGYAGVDDPTAYAYGDARETWEDEVQRAEATRAEASRQSPEALEPEPSNEDPVQEPPPAMNSVRREAAERKAAKDLAVAAGRGGQGAFAQVANVTDPFIAHQLAKLGVNEEKYKEAMDAAAAERAAALAAAKAHGRGNQLAGVLDGYGGESSFKPRKNGDYYDEDHGEYYRQQAGAARPAAGAAKPAPLEREPSPASRRRSPAPSPFEVSDKDDRRHYRTASMEQSAALRNATYEAPKFGRQRAQDLMITGPSMRGSGNAPSTRSAGGFARGGANVGYAQSTYGSECTTTVAATSYYNA